MYKNSVKKSINFSAENLHLYHYSGNNPIKYVDPTGLYTQEEIESFSQMTFSQQMNFLKNEYNSVQGNSHTDLQRGSKSAEMRELRSGMKLKGLFKLDGDFMNSDLRDFLNLKEDGTMNYKKEELTKDNGWKELCSIGSQYHQTNASTDPSNLNSKLVNKDGREVVINRDGIISNSYPDKGTFNYADGTALSSIGWGKHKQFDMIPYDNLMSTLNKQTEKKYNGIFKGGGWHGNSYYW